MYIIMGVKGLLDCVGCQEPIITCWEVKAIYASPLLHYHLNKYSAPLADMTIARELIEKMLVTVHIGNLLYWTEAFWNEIKL